MKKFFSFIITFIFLISSIRPAFTMETAAKEAIIMEYPSMQILYEKNAHRPMTPSSMVKLMTLYVAFLSLEDNIMSLDKKFTVSKKAWQQVGSRMFLNVRDNVSVADLIRGVIVHSGNDACIALAEAISGSVDEFVNIMNYQAKKIGMKSTFFTNPTGMPDEKLKSTAFDIALLSAKIMNEFPEYYSFFAEKKFTYNKITQINRNSLLRIRGIDGLKTGSTKAGGYGIAISGQHDGRRMIVVVNGLEDSNSRKQAALNLWNHGLNNFKMNKLYSKGDILAKIPTHYGERDYINAVTKKDIKIVTPRYVTTKTIVSYQDMIPTPISKGDVIANIKIVDEMRKVYYNDDLVAEKKTSRASFLYRAIQNLRYLLR